MIDDMKDEHHMDFMFGPDLTPKEQAKADIVEMEKQIALEQEQEDDHK